MDFNIDFNLVRSQKLLLIPQLKQALEMLEMNSQELFAYVEAQIESNPALEVALEEKPLFEAAEEDTEAGLPEDTPAVLSLKENLLLQLYALKLDRKTVSIGEYLIDNTDANGYLAVDILEVAAYFGIPAARVEKVLGLLQSMDPPGICARNLRECLLLQLNQMEEVDQRVVDIIEKHLDQLAANDIKAVAESMGIDELKAGELFRQVRSLEPRPGREFFGGESLAAPNADVFIRNIDGRLVALLNEEAFPDVNTSEECRLAFSEGNQQSAGLSFMQEKAQSAIWLIKSLEQRKNIILRIAERLLDEQKGFFEEGTVRLEHLDPVLFADALDMHETILQKALNGKYLQCRWGTFPFKDFFD